MAITATVPFVVCEDHALFNQRISDFLVKQAGFTSLGRFTNGQQLIDYVTRHAPEEDRLVAIIDLVMPGPDGFALLSFLKNHPRILPVVLTGQKDHFILRQAREKGARAIVLKDKMFDTLVTAIKQVYEGNTWFPEDLF